MLTQRLYRNLHTWFGIGFGLVFLLLAVTGTLLHYEDYLYPPPVVVPPELAGQPPISVDAIIAKGTERLGGPPHAVELSHDGAQPVMLSRFPDQLFYSRSGQFIAHRQENETWRFFVMALHSGGFAGVYGAWFFSVAGVVLFGSVLSGVVIWPWLVRLRRRSGR